jgi:RNA polymerase-binding transcription factor DksA
MPNKSKKAKPAAKKTNTKSAKPAIKSSKSAAKSTTKKPLVKSAKQAPQKASANKAAKAAPKPAAKSIKKAAPAKPAAKNLTKQAKPAPLKKATPAPAAKKAAPPKKAAPAAPAKKAAVEAGKKASAEVSTKAVAQAAAASKKPEPTPLPKAKDIKVSPPKPVVIPKISHNNTRKYEPDFTKSVLDQTPVESNGPTMRYSDAELNEFRELIQRKLETAKKELGYLQGLITRKDEMGGDETDNRYMTMEDGSLSMEREQLSQMASRQITFIDHLEKAMMRIENKTYGICRVTGKLIDKARLRAVPHATLSIEAKMGINK